MESLCTFEPFWQRSDVVSAPQEAIEEIRVKSLNLYLEKHKGERPRPECLDDIAAECANVIQLLLQDLGDENEILQRLHQVGHHERNDGMQIVRGALSMWYADATPAITRDPLQGLDPEAAPEYDENGEEFEPWSREFSQKRHASANLGLVAILMTLEPWLPPVHPLLKAGSLISRSVTTVLYAAFLISPQMLQKPWLYLLEQTRPEETMRLFLKSAWSLGRENYDELDASQPGIEFGASLDEVKLTSDGKNLITNIGRSDWHCPPIWHPIRRVPGSAWNKFLRNHKQPMFPESPSQAGGFHMTIPSSLRTLAQPFEKYYSELRSRMDQTGRPRIVLPQEALDQQYKELAAATGRSYPMMELSENTATSTEEPLQEYLYRLPMVKKPITDLRGNLTLPFLNTLVRAWRFQEEPDEVCPDLQIMSFTGR